MSGTIGGTFCAFGVGSSGAGRSARSLRYMARAEAVRDGEGGMSFHNIPAAISEEAGYAGRVASLCQYARERERRELPRHRSRGVCRTHYTAKLSFESPLDTVEVKRMALSWLEVVLPRARAVLFVHRNTAHLHVHIWIEARQVDDRKISLSARAYRQLDEAWNRLYADAFGRDEREHLHKKWRTEACKAMRRQGDVLSLPERVGHLWRPSEFTERERTRLGVELYEREQSGTGEYQRPVAGDNPAPAAGEHAVDPAESAAAREDAGLRALYREAHRALSEIEALNQAMATRERGRRAVQREVADRDAPDRDRFEPER